MTPGFAIQTALLHDTIEDTATTRAELEERFGEDIAEAVWALTKDPKLLKDYRLTDVPWRRSGNAGKEVWAVKLADRITNLQKPPRGLGQDSCRGILL
ncbi:MAG: hypothetical protein MZV63_55150 [Marinilabiliales bacterium]|nr:hypothetical protein [Marinilabiliales bacterium]